MAEKEKNTASKNEPTGGMQISSIDANGNQSMTEIRGLKAESEEQKQKTISTKSFYNLTPEQIELAVRMISKGITDAGTIGVAMQHIDPPKEAQEVIENAQKR